MAVKEILWPSGVNRRLSFRQNVGRRERYYSPWSINCRLEDMTGRLRGGSWTPDDAASPSSTQSQYLTNSDGDNITDSGGDPIVVSVEEFATHSGNYVMVEAGADAPGTHAAQCVYRDRLIQPDGTIIYASRQGDYTDWDYGVDVSNVGRAFVIQLSEAGETGNDVVALIPHKDHYLLAATSGTLWVVQGDPTAGGTLRNISRDVGIISAKAWCRDHLDRYYFLSSHGLYTVSADGSGLQALSEDVIPEQLTDVVDSDTVLEYDHETRGVYIHIPTADESWLFDTERQGFWPFIVGYAGSHVAIGPFALGNKGSFGRLLRLHGVTASNSADVTWRVLVADTAEEVASNAKAAIDALVASAAPADIHSSGTWVAGVNNRAYPRSRSKYMILLLSASDDWAWEGSHIVTMQSGSWR